MDSKQTSPPAAGSRTPPGTGTPPTGSAASLRLVLTIQGKQIPSKKNRHYCSVPKPGRRARVLMDEKIKKRLEAITRDFVFQLLSESQTSGTMMQTGCSPLSWIASLLPEDDSWKWVPDLTVHCEKVKKGQEGCEITIEQDHHLTLANHVPH